MKKLLTLLFVLTLSGCATYGYRGEVALGSGPRYDCWDSINAVVCYDYYSGRYFRYYTSSPYYGYWRGYVNVYRPRTYYVPRGKVTTRRPTTRYKEPVRTPTRRAVPRSNRPQPETQRPRPETRRPVVKAPAKPRPTPPVRRPPPKKRKPGGGNG